MFLNKTYLLFFITLFFVCSKLFAEPQGISNLTALATTNEGEIVLEWTSPDPQDGLSSPSNYLIKYATSEITSSDFYSSWVSTFTHNWAVFVSSGLDESRTLTGLTPGSTLYFAVKAEDSFNAYGVWNSSSDTGGVINTANFAVVYDSTPAQVLGVNAVMGDEFIDISWTLNSEIDIYEYEIESSSYSDTLGFSSLISILSPGNTHQDTGLVNGNTYYYRIRAVDNTNNSGAFSTVQSTMAWVNVGQPSFSIDCFAVSTISINWAWGLTLNAKGYRVINTTSSENMSGDLASGDTYWIQTGLTPNTSCAVYVQGFNDLLTSDSSDMIIYSLCNPPCDIISTQTTSKINLSWSDNNNSSCTQYSVELSSDNFVTDTNLVMNLAVSTTHQDTTLMEGSTYYYRIWATNNDGMPITPVVGVDKIEFSTITSRISPSAPFLNINSKTGTDDGEVDLSWNASGDDDVTGICSDYLIKWATYCITSDNFNNISSNTVFVATLDPPNPENLTITGLYPGTTYYFGLKARDEVLNYSVLSNTKTICAQDKQPQPPSNVSSLATSSCTVDFSWTLPGYTGYDDRDKYKIYRATFSFTSYQPNVSTFSVSHPTTYFTDSDLEAETTYFYRVSCLDEGDIGNGYYSHILESNLSQEASVRTPDTTPPDSISQLTVLTGSVEGEIDLTWTSPGDDGSINTISQGCFRIDWSTESTKDFQLSDYKVDITTSTNPDEQQVYTATGLNSGATYYFRIWTRDESNNWSSISLGATSWAQIDVTEPSAITDLTAASLWRRCVLNWISPGDDGTTGTLNGYYEVRASTESPIDTQPKWDQVSTGYPYRILWSTSTSPNNFESKVVTGLENGTTYYFSIKACDELNNWASISSTSPKVLPFNQYPSSFSLISPDNDSISSISRPTFDWDDSSDNDSIYGDNIIYNLYYSTETNFLVEVTTTVYNIVESSYTVTHDLAEDKTIYWRVEVQDSDNYTTQCSSQYYKVHMNISNSPPNSFDLASPGSGGIVYVSTPTISWNAASDNDPGDTITYNVDYSISSDFVTYSSSSGISNINYITPSLNENTTYWWRVWAYDGQDITLCNTTYYFKVNASSEAPNSFNLISPANNERQLSIKVTFYWEVTTDPDPDDSVVYNLVYSLSYDFNALFSTSITGLTQPTTVVDLIWGDNIDYYWKVEAVGVNDGEICTSTQIRSIYTDFVKQLPSSFNLTEPIYSVVISTTLKPLFLWESSIDPDPQDTVRYYIDISEHSDFQGSVPIPTGTDNFYQPIVNLLDQTTYYWKVRASGYQGGPPVQVDPDYVFSSTGVFIISMTNNPPNSFSLTSPCLGATVNTKTPTFVWQEAIDSDVDDVVTYELYISSEAGFSTVLSTISSISNTQYSYQTLLEEDRTYYWKVTAFDKKLAQTDSSSIFSFYIPVLSKPVSPFGLKGTLSQDELTLTIYWATVALNIDGTALDDLSGYNIYRAVSMAALNSATLVANIPSGTNEWSDNIQGANYYYFIRAVDNSGVESDNSLILNSLEPDKLMLIYNDQEVVVELSQEASECLLAGNNLLQQDLSITLERNQEFEQGSIIRSYDLKVRDSNMQEIDAYDFVYPLTLQINYGSISQAQGICKYAPDYTLGSLAVYWHNGVEFIRVGSYMEDSRKRLVLKITRPGQYQLRQVQRAVKFGLASINPSKVFTPGIAPYEKAYFYVDNPQGDNVTGKIYDLRGEFISDLESVSDSTDTSVILQWDGENVSKGVYIYQIEAEGKVINGTIIIAR